MKYKMFLFTFFLVLLYASNVMADQTNICSKASDKLICLKNNFETLYSEDYDSFWAILHSAAADANTCESLRKTADFLDLVNVTQINAEFNEFYSSVIEKIVMTKTECFVSAFNLIDREARNKISKKLQAPLFVPYIQIEDKIKDYKIL